MAAGDPGGKGAAARRSGIFRGGFAAKKRPPEKSSGGPAVGGPTGPRFPEFAVQSPRINPYRALSETDTARPSASVPETRQV
jgi:hypothetical protein